MLLKFKIQYLVKRTNQRCKSGCGYEQIYLCFWKRSGLINVVIVNALVVPGTRFYTNFSMGPILFSDSFSLCFACKVLHPNKTACIVTIYVTPKQRFIKAYSGVQGKLHALLNSISY
jgi:hypothetical protein